jgi:Rrf2 family protein
MRLRLTKRTDYAVRACLLLAVSPDVPVSNRRIAQRMVVPDRFLPQVLSDLARAGIIESTSGKLGGYRLSRDPTDLTLLELIETMEGPSRSETCVLEEHPCSGDSACALHSVWSAAQSAFLQVLAGTTLAEIAARQWTVPVDGPDRRTSPERNLA